MTTRRQTCTQAASLITLSISQALGRDAKVGGVGLAVPFEFAQGRGSMLVPARINSKPALLIIDTGSAHTIVRPSVAGVSPAELAPPLVGAGIMGDAVGREVTLEVGRQVWQRRGVAVMDLSQMLAAYRETIDGLLGMDFFLEFSQCVINLKDRTVTFVA
jgi:hypothetical protein